MSNKIYIEKLEEENKKLEAVNGNLSSKLRIAEYQLVVVLQKVRQFQPQETIDEVNGILSNIRNEYMVPTITFDA